MPRYPAYRHIPHESSDSLPSDVCTMREYVPSPPGTSTIPHSSKFHGGVEETDKVYEPQQMLFMMPMQMSAPNGQMMPVLMTPGVMTSSVGPNMMYCMTPARQTASATRQRLVISILPQRNDGSG
ncbi:unnamed protein product [Cylicostephanus goldi]|uniref:Uncharacterized protein n=1 Tax=Cylicostephanus goldi TaxID=71465 RepID=A0A3P6TBC3_CYLGO|nr:unnamed protein product [Cylicostephanus goldi]